MKKISFPRLISALISAMIFISCNKSNDASTGLIVGEWYPNRFQGTLTDYRTTPPSSAPFDEVYTRAEVMVFKFGNDNVFSAQDCDTCAFRKIGSYEVTNNYTRLIVHYTANPSDTTVHSISINGNILKMSFAIDYRMDTTIYESKDGTLTLERQ